MKHLSKFLEERYVAHGAFGGLVAQLARAVIKDLTPMRDFDRDLERDLTKLSVRVDQMEKQLQPKEEVNEPERKISSLKNDEVICCRTAAESHQILALLERHGYIISNIHWHTYDYLTCYKLDDRVVYLAPISFYLDKDYTAVPASKFLPK